MHFSNLSFFFPALPWHPDSSLLHLGGSWCADTRSRRRLKAAITSASHHGGGSAAGSVDEVVAFARKHGIPVVDVDQIALWASAHTSRGLGRGAGRSRALSLLPAAAVAAGPLARRLVVEDASSMFAPLVLVRALCWWPLQPLVCLPLVYVARRCGCCYLRIDGVCYCPCPSS